MTESLKQRSKAPLYGPTCGLPVGYLEPVRRDDRKTPPGAGATWLELEGALGGRRVSQASQIVTIEKFSSVHTAHVHCVLVFVVVVVVAVLLVVVVILVVVGVVRDVYLRVSRNFFECGCIVYVECVCVCG